MDIAEQGKERMLLPPVSRCPGVLVSFWKTSPKLMSLQGQVSAKMTAYQRVCDSSWTQMRVSCDLLR